MTLSLPVRPQFAKHRNIEDFRLAVDELDDLQHLQLRLCIRDLRCVAARSLFAPAWLSTHAPSLPASPAVPLGGYSNAYANLHDTSMKNMDRLKKPRGSGSGRSGMY